MSRLINDILTARGWSVRRLAEQAGLSYSGVLDHLRGIPQRLSQERLARVHERLQLDDSGNIRTGTVYAWGVRLEQDRLSALGRILESIAGGEDGGSAWEMHPFVGESTRPGEFCALRRGDAALLVRWQPPKFEAPAPDESPFHMGRRNRSAPAPSHPQPESLGNVLWAPGLGPDGTGFSGVPMTPERLSRLMESEHPLTVSELDAWLGGARDPGNRVSGADAPRGSAVEWRDAIDALKAKFPDPSDALAAIESLASGQDGRDEPEDHSSGPR